jgi:hypothetical protein
MTLVPVSESGATKEQYQNHPDLVEEKNSSATHLVFSSQLIGGPEGMSCLQYRMLER